jgi:alpha-N-arabinofuranosidase
MLRQFYAKILLAIFSSILLSFAEKGDETKVRIDLTNIIGEINPNIYGHFIEHLDKCIYGGIWKRNDFNYKVVDLIKGLNPPIMRWPGGNFASGYHWMDGIGPIENRPKKYDLAWHATDPNTFGTDEFIKLCRMVNCEPYICVNMGSGTAEEAANWVEYCNLPAGASYYADLRVKNGHEQPYGVKYWGLGNEVYGDWQIGHTDAHTYALNAREFSKRMKWVDPSIKTIAVGCDDPQWNWEVLMIAGPHIDYISLHEYYDHPDYYERVASPLAAERSLKRLAATILAATGENRIKIAFDEWNLWRPQGLASALFSAGIFNVLHRLCQDVHIACLAQLVNVLPLIIADEKGERPTPSYFVFQLYRQHAGPLALKVDVDGESYTSRAWGGEIQVPFIDVSATLDKGSNKLTIFILNRDKEKSRECEIKIRDWQGKAEGQVWELNGKDVESDEVEVKERGKIIITPTFKYTAPAHSLTVIEGKLNL